MSAGVGDTLGGRYTLTDRIAAGGMGEVWAATDAILGRTVAVKVLKGGLTDEVGFDQRFRTEARLAAALSHANIAAVYDYGEDEGSAYLVMEYVPGLPLSRIIADRSPMPAVDTVGLVAQTATALQSAHLNGLVHRDVKPANVLVTADGIVKLTDFGIARAVGSAAMTKAGEVMGTAQYLAPEAALGQETTPLSDVYALAVVAYEMLCGARPFNSDSPVALAMAHVNEQPPPMPDFVPPPVRAVVLAALEKDPQFRPDSAAEFARALQQSIVDSARMGFDPYSEPPRRGEWSPSRPSQQAEGRRRRRDRKDPGPHSGPQGAAAFGPDEYPGQEFGDAGRDPDRRRGERGARSASSGPQLIDDSFAGTSGPQVTHGDRPRGHQLPGRRMTEHLSSGPGATHVLAPGADQQRLGEPDHGRSSGSRPSTQPADRSQTRRYVVLAALALVVVIVAVVLVVLLRSRSSGTPQERFTKPVQIATLRHPGGPTTELP
ncbi:serine/threonine-protein kinase [Allobranchiibius sp. CTAmp26]|uniref:serine/threonine-protein kinase n=1 Tax=Allobranchiibius sp. CTAmp26 TaxID=2815214 RepID=UPI001AA15F0D|nr:serine/threonine-protein kinase [Allobranchiibius sp. CTAmp26]MBO1755065.1 serine/threonine protein kinase [Allobranchiibius sp. CTAmp26]